jgi:hypothetical protein
MKRGRGEDHDEVEQLKTEEKKLNVEHKTYWMPFIAPRTVLVGFSDADVLAYRRVAMSNPRVDGASIVGVDQVEKAGRGFDSFFFVFVFFFLLLCSCLGVVQRIVIAREGAGAERWEEGRLLEWCGPIDLLQEAVYRHFKLHQLTIREVPFSSGDTGSIPAVVVEGGWTGSLRWGKVSRSCMKQKYLSAHRLCGTTAALRQLLESLPEGVGVECEGNVVLHKSSFYNCLVYRRLAVPVAVWPSEENIVCNYDSPLSDRLKRIFFGADSVIKGEEELVRTAISKLQLRSINDDRNVWPAALSMAPLVRRYAWNCLWETLATQCRLLPALRPLKGLFPASRQTLTWPEAPPLSKGPLYPQIANPNSKPRFGGGDGE